LNGVETQPVTQRPVAGANWSAKKIESSFAVSAASARSRQ
jgi:hypothetical protein